MRDKDKQSLLDKTTLNEAKDNVSNLYNHTMYGPLLTDVKTVSNDDGSLTISGTMTDNFKDMAHDCIINSKRGAIIDYDFIISPSNVHTMFVEGQVEQISDGYHTFEELYDHRAKLFAVICMVYSKIAWKSLVHNDGTMYNGMFVVGIDTPEGQATYHYNVVKYWALFEIPELKYAPEYDGHTPAEAINRILSLVGLEV